ncbi:Protease HtpX [compost metagenome]
MQAAVSRQREHLADARAVQWTRSRDGLGGVLRKILTQQQAGLETRAVGSVVQHMLLVANESGKVAGWFDSHPPLNERIRRIYGRSLGPLPLQRETEPEAVPPTAAPGADAPGWTLV